MILLCLWLLYGAFRFLAPLIIPSPFTFSRPHCHTTTDSATSCNARLMKAVSSAVRFSFVLHHFKPLQMLLRLIPAVTVLGPQPLTMPDPNSVYAVGFAWVSPHVHPTHVNSQKHQLQRESCSLFHAGEPPSPSS